jgi:hypothetical protein
LANKTREEALQEAKSKAIEAACEAGALRESIRIVDVVDVPLSYLPGTNVSSILSGVVHKLRHE